MTLATEAKLGALFITAQKMISLNQTLIEMGWPQPKSSIQTDNTTAEGVVNATIIPNKLKSMDLRLYWQQCCEAQKHFRFYWDKGPNKWGDYSTKHHPPVHHLSYRPLFADAVFSLYNILRRPRV